MASTSKWPQIWRSGWEDRFKRFKINTRNSSAHKISDLWWWGDDSARCTSVFLYMCWCSDRTHLWYHFGCYGGTPIFSISALHCSTIHLLPVIFVTRHKQSIFEFDIHLRVDSQTCKELEDLNAEGGQMWTTLANRVRDRRIRVDPFTRFAYSLSAIRISPESWHALLSPQLSSEVKELRS